MQEYDITQLMTELGLDANDQQSRAALTQLLNAKPNVVVNAVFKQQLRNDLKNHIAAQSLGTPVSSPTNYSTINIFTTVMQKFMVPALVAVVLLVAGGVWYTNQTNPGLINLGGGELLSSKYSVDELAANSFGDLSQVSVASADRNQSGGGGGAAGLGAGGDASMPEGTKVAAPAVGIGGGGGDASILPYPDSFKFSYEGEDLTGLADTQSVLKRIKPEQNGGIVSRIISFFSFGLIDLSKFNNTRIQNFSFVEDKEYGLGANVDLSYGNVSLYQNWEKWPQPRYVCEEGGYCGPEPRITEKDIPSDEEAIAIANQFVSDYGISLDGYGAPIIFEYMPWRIAYENAADKANFYFPEVVNVMYPLTLDGQGVYDESGMPSGMTVNIDVRTRKVNGMYGLETKQFQKSDYAGETDTKRILEIAERGGYRNYGWNNGGKTVTLELQTPTIQLVRLWYSSDPTKQGEELYVPSLVFPIKNASENNYWRKSITVPLVKDLLDNENPGGGPVMPLETPIPVEPDNGIGDTPDAPVSTEPSTSTIAQ